MAQSCLTCPFNEYLFSIAVCQLLLNCIHVSRCSASFHISRVADGSFDPSILESSPSKAKSFANVIKSTMGSVDSWSADSLETLGGDIVKTLTVTDLKNLDPTAVSFALPLIIRLSLCELLVLFGL